MDGEPTEPVPFQELRYLWHVVNEVFGKENAVPVRQEGGVEDDLSDGPDMERPPEAPEGGEGAGGEEEEKPEAKATIPKQDTVRLLHTLTGELLDALDGHDPDVLASLSQLTDPLLVGDAATHPLLAKIGFIPPEENPTENPWLFCGVKYVLFCFEVIIINTITGEACSRLQTTSSTQSSVADTRTNALQYVDLCARCLLHATLPNSTLQLRWR